MSCVIEKDCKRAPDTVLRAFDLTWFCARKWRAGIYVAAETRIRAQPLSTGSSQPTTGYQHRATGAGWTGEEEPDWTQEEVVDGSVTWVREAVTPSSLERTIEAEGDVEWDASSDMSVSSPTLDVGSGQVGISALHSGGVAGRTGRTWADVIFSDDTKERFEIQWKVT